MILLSLALLASAPIASMSDDQLDQKLAATQKILNVGDRIDAVSSLLLGSPYLEYPLGEGGSGPEPQARWRLDGVDCQTFVETVLALSNSKSTSQAKKILDDIRYGKEPVSFGNRNHFTEAQWLPANISKGYLRDEVPAIDGRAPSAELVLKRSQWMHVNALARLRGANIPEGSFPIRYLTPSQLKKKQANIETGSVILVVRESDPKRIVRTSHMGFVLRGSNGIIVRHATTGPEHQVIDEPLDAYLHRMDSFKKWRVIGYGLAMPLDDKVRAAGMQ